MDEQTTQRIRSAQTEYEKRQLAHNHLQENSGENSEFFRCGMARRDELINQLLASVR
jgi:hypothetical protein